MEYNRNFTDNIRASQFNQRAEEIANWIEKNRELYDWAKAPNAYEMTNVFLFAGKYKFEGKDINLEAVKRIWELRKGDFARCGVQDNNFIYQICEQSYNAAISGRALVNDESSHSALRKMAGVGLYLMSQKEKQFLEYNNPDELINLMEDSRVLKEKHPILHSELKFENNLKFLYTIQVQQLDEQAKQELDEVYNEYLSEQIQSDRNSNDTKAR